MSEPTDHHPEPNPDPSNVRAALRALATGGPSELGSKRPETVVANAVEAVEDVRAVAAFVADGGPARLRTAVAAAERAGDRKLARDGQRVLALLERYQRAAAGGDRTRGTVFSAAGQPPIE